MPLLIPVHGSSTCEDLSKQVETAYLYGYEEEQSPAASEADQAPVDDGEGSQRSLINHAVGFIKSFSGQIAVPGARPIKVLVVGSSTSVPFSMFFSGGFSFLVLTSAHVGWLAGLLGDV